ncbi:MAG: gene transfer agent family protein [Pseudomonadota bacterium]
MNGVRGETALVIDGVPRRLCLTLGALAEIESELGCETLAELDTRMRQLSARDLSTVLKALLRGGGETIEPENVGPGDAARAVAEAFVRGLGN